MPMATFTTADALAVFMLSEIGPLADDLGLTVDALAAAVEDAIYAYFGDTGGVITDATDTRKLRALARVEAWRTAVAWCAADFDTSADGESLSLSQRYKNAQGRLADARNRAASYADANRVVITDIRYTGEPFYRAISTTEF